MFFFNVTFQKWSFRGLIPRLRAADGLTACTVLWFDPPKVFSGLVKKSAPSIVFEREGHFSLFKWGLKGMWFSQTYYSQVADSLLYVRHQYLLKDLTYIVLRTPEWPYRLQRKTCWLRPVYLPVSRHILLPPAVFALQVLCLMSTGMYTTHTTV